MGVPHFWPEISDKIDLIEVLYENKNFANRELAALLVSKLYFQLGDLDESLNYALCADDKFDISESSEYIETIAFKCIDAYTEFRQKKEMEELNGNGNNSKKDSMSDALNIPKSDQSLSCDRRMEKLVERMLYQSLSDGKLCEAAGIAIETRRYDILEDAIKGLSSVKIDEMIDYVAKLCLTVVEESGLRKKILLLLVKISKQMSNPNYINVCSCLVHLNDATMVAEILKTLCESDDQSNKLVGFQIAFDLYENSTQGFIKRITSMLAPSETAKQEDSDIDLSPKDKKSIEAAKKLTEILQGDVTIDHHLQFLIRNNNADIQILQKTKEHVKNSVTHNATIISNAMMYAGTTSAKFLRDNLDWLSRSTNWAKFTATSSVGVIHKGHEADALKLLSIYLPKDSATSTSPYQEGGGYYALGLIHANHGNPEITQYIKDALTNVDGSTGEAKAEPARHGALLGLGLCAMGTHDMELYELMREQLTCDDAVIGEAAGVAMGLLMAGSNNKDVLEEMINYARDTQHEKIVRGLSLGISLILYGQLDNPEATKTIEELSNDKEPLLRRAGCLATGLAWVGTGSNDALSKMLHTAVSDVSDDVRRASVQAIGFILARNPENCPHVVELLSHSYNPHVRAGAATALGIACAATGNKEALTLLEPMLNDPVNYVRQAAVISAAMILIQHTEHTSNGKSKHFRDMFQKMVEDKHEDIMGKFGAIIAQGIIDAGGRNCSINLADARTGHVHMPSVVGVTCFLSTWYWFPMSHFLSLALRPACFIALNKDLNLPQVQVKCASKPSAFAYPSKIETKKEKKKEKVETAVLSVSNKKKAEEAK